MNQRISKREQEKIELINQAVLKGESYSEAIDHEPKQYTKYANFKITDKSMTEEKRSAKETSKEQSSEKKTESSEITKDNFKWRTKDKEVSLDEMDADFKLIAMAHCLKLSNNHFEKYNDYQKKRDFHYNKTSYFVKMADILEDSLLTDHGLQPPSSVEDVKAMRRMIKEGIIKIKHPEPVVERHE